MSLGIGTRLHFLSAQYTGKLTAAPQHPVVVVTGLRNPCPQIEKFEKDLQEKFITRDEQRNIIGRKAGVMSTVEVEGEVKSGCTIVVESPADFKPLVCV